MEPLVELPFVGGIDEASRVEHVPQGGWTSLENVRQDARGGVTKRFGFGVQTRDRLIGAARTRGERLVPHALQTGIIDGHELDIYNATLDRSVPAGRVPECVAERYPLAFTTRDLDGNDTFMSSHVVGGYLASAVAVPDVVLPVTDPPAAVTSWTILVTLYDAATLSVVRFLDTLATAGISYVSLVNVGATLVVVYAESDAIVWGRTLDTSSPAGIAAGWTAPVTLVSNGALTRLQPDGIRAVTYPKIDTQSLADRFAIAYINTNGATSRVTVATYNAALATLDAVLVNTSSVAPSYVSVDGSIADTLWVGWNEATLAKVIGLDADALAATLATTATLITLNGTAQGGPFGVVVTGPGAGKLVVIDEPFGPNALSVRTREFSTVAGAVVGAPGFASTFWRIYPVGKPFRVDGRDYILAFDWENTFLLTSGEVNSYLVDITDGNVAGTSRPVAVVAPRLAVLIAGRQRMSALSLTKLGALVSVRDTSISSGVDLARFDFADARIWQQADSMGSTLLSSGCTTEYDGNTTYELNFVHRPLYINALATAIVASVPPTIANYLAVYEWTDATGNLHQSAPSPPVSMSPAGKWVSVTVPTLALTSRHAPGRKVRIAIYRADDGGTYKRLAVLENAPESETVEYLDGITTAAHAEEGELYTQPGLLGAALDRVGPPSFTHAINYADMVVGVAEDGYSLWWSGQRIAGEGIWFADAFQVPVPEGGRVQALAAQDGTLYVFKRGAIYALTGEAPSDNGAVGGLGNPRRLATDLGAAQHVTCVTSKGVWFVSERGIELLTRSQQVEWVGESVQETFATFPVVTSMTFDPSSSCLLIECSQREAGTGLPTGDGRTLVFDVKASIWQSVDRRTGEDDDANARAAHGALVWSGAAWRYTWLAPDGRVYVEDHQGHRDVTNWVTQRARTGWIHIAGLQGEQLLDRVLCLADQHTDHEFTMDVIHDYNEGGAAESKTWTAAQLGALTRQWIDREIIQARGQAIRIRLSDAEPVDAPVGSGKGATWVALTLSGEPQRGPKRTTAAQRGVAA